jgi:Ser/Thr protein kinase RdoA (MazF antagonist)
MLPAHLRFVAYPEWGSANRTGPWNGIWGAESARLDDVEPPADASAADRPRRLGGGVRTHVWEVKTRAGLRVIKISEVSLAAHEVDVLVRLAGSNLGPRLVAAGEGILVTERIDGAPLPPGSWSAAQAAALGRLVRRLHDLPAPSLGDGPSAAEERYRDVRIAAIRRDCRPEARVLTESSIAALPVVASEPLVLLHGDPWSGNVVWGAAGPVLVDWEYARLGERAEDLAYLAALDALAPATLAAVLGGYGAPSALRDRVDAWRPLMACWCGSWLVDRGETDRGARLLAHAERLLTARGPGGSSGASPRPRRSPMSDG